MPRLPAVTLSPRGPNEALTPLLLIFSRMPGARVIRFLNHLGEVVAAINLSGPEAVMDDPQA
ncbi:hypothetical protein RT21_06155 [Pseudomonas sp. 10B238]|nr:hypothetical protein RT21_06155 [Pseudomonas sp. 10B238]